MCIIRRQRHGTIIVSARRLIVGRHTFPDDSAYKRPSKCFAAVVSVGGVELVLPPHIHAFQRIISLAQFQSALLGLEMMARSSILLALRCFLNLKAVYSKYLTIALVREQRAGLYTAPSTFIEAMIEHCHHRSFHSAVRLSLCYSVRPSFFPQEHPYSRDQMCSHPTPQI